MDTATGSVRKSTMERSWKSSQFSTYTIAAAAPPAAPASFVAMLLPFSCASYAAQARERGESKGMDLGVSIDQEKVAGEAYAPNEWNVEGTSGSFGAGDRRERL